ncbi:MAG: ABC transporter ATP-binding protein/permease, partial [Chloroflexota bacterium]|nr:ABC transporter ATP-binding protein/permease [Chloroflexota bacterium]
SRTMAALDELRRGLGARVTLASALSAGVGALIYVSLVWLVAAGARTIGELTLYGGAAALLQARLVAVSYYLGFLPQPLSALPSVFRVLDAPPDLPQSPLPIQREPTRREPARRAPQPAVQGITFDHVAFRYPQSTSAAPKNAAPANAGSTNSGTAGEGDTPTPAAERPTSIPVLSDLSFAIAPGESLALVGHNGAGKTTIVKLLLRLYDPTAGRILLDGVDLREYDLDDLRRQMGVIFQDFGRYALTAGENIGLGQVEALGDRERLERAARRAGAADVIASLPKGLDTRLGREFGTRELSGGEWQKLALARAFMRDCQVLVLDEPTAALDVQTEHDVYTRFHRLTRDRMTLLISHRFSTVRLADHILVLENGRIAERGSHEELVALGGRYATLFEMQAGRYR